MKQVYDWLGRNLKMTSSSNYLLQFFSLYLELLHMHKASFNTQNVNQSKNKPEIYIISCLLLTRRSKRLLYRTDGNHSHGCLDSCGRALLLCNLRRSLAKGGEKMGARVFWRTLKQESQDVEELKGRE